MKKKELLKIQDLTIEFQGEKGKILAVNNVSFSVYQKEIVALVGESGCGKTILCRSIPQILPESAVIRSGNIFFDNQDLILYKTSNMKQIRGKEIGIVWQNPVTFFHPSIPIGNQITEALRIHKKLSKKEARTFISPILEQLGLEEMKERLKDYPVSFSGGQLQRAVIATAISCNPKLLIADEPTTALDVKSQKQVLDLIKMLKEKKGMTVLLVTHNLSAALNYADRIVVMHNGQMIEQGDTEQIAKNPQKKETKALLNAVPAAWEEWN